MPWVKIDEQFYDSEKWADAPGDSIALWLASMAWCNRNNSVAGFIPTVKTQGLVAVRNHRRTLADLCDREAFHQVDGGFIIHDYTEYQQPEKVKAIAEARSAAGKKGARARWADKTPPMANGMAIAIANGRQVPKQTDAPITDLPSSTYIPLPLTGGVPESAGRRWMLSDDELGQIDG
jgi:hypothetical protein